MSSRLLAVSTPKSPCLKPRGLSILPFAGLVVSLASVVTEDHLNHGALACVLGFESLVVSLLFDHTQHLDEELLGARLAFDGPRRCFRTTESRSAT